MHVCKVPVLGAKLYIEPLRQNKQKRANVVQMVLISSLKIILHLLLSIISKVGSSGSMISKHRGQGHPSMKSTQTDLVIDNMLTFFSCFVFLCFCERFLNQKNIAGWHPFLVEVLVYKLKIQTQKVQSP